MTSQNKSLIPEVSILRPVTVVLLVLMHSFTVFNHSWRPFDGYIDIETYKWITRVSFNFMMEMFVFISGYVLAYQIITLGRTYKWLDFAKRKFQRLIVPSIVFSLIYIPLLPDKTLIYNSLQGGGCWPLLMAWDTCGFFQCCFGVLLWVSL